MAIDLEGDPFWRADRDLTFMFGLLERAGDGWTYRAEWAHDEVEESRLAGHVIDAIHARLRADPAMHVYHYGAVEVSVLKRICMLNATHEERLDELLRGHVFVDVVQAVRQAMRIGLESYGLKSVEKLPGFVRTADVGRGADAVLEYERWLADGDDAHLRGDRALQRRGLPLDGRRGRLAADAGAGRCRVAAAARRRRRAGGR